MSHNLPRRTARAILAVLGPQRIAVVSDNDDLTVALRDEGVETLRVPNAESVPAVIRTLVIQGNQSDALGIAEPNSAYNLLTIILYDVGSARAAIAARMFSLGWRAHPRSFRALDLLVLVRSEAGSKGALDAAPSAYDLLSNFIRAGDLVLTAGVTAAAQDILAANSRSRTIKSLALSGSPEREGDQGASGIIILNCVDDKVEEALNAFPGEICQRLAPGGRLAIIRESDALPTTLDLLDSLDDELILERAFTILDEGVYECDPRDPPIGTAITLAVRSPLASSDAHYVERAFQLPDDPRFDVVDFASAYKFPGIVRALVTRGERVTTPDALVGLARRVLPELPSGSVDRGAVLCTLGYQALEMRAAASPLEHLVAQIDDWLGEAAEPSGHTLRWAVSLTALKSKIQRRLGRFEEALESAEACAALDPIPFSPLLAARTIEALFFIATIKLGRSDVTGAVEALDRAIRSTRAAITADWINVIGDAAAPLSFGLYELGTVINLASRCAVLRGSVDEIASRPGHVWEHAAVLAREAAWTASPVADLHLPSASSLATVATARSFAEEAYRLFGLARRQADDAITDSIAQQRQRLEAQRQADQAQAELDSLRSALGDVYPGMVSPEDGEGEDQPSNAESATKFAAVVRSRLCALEQQLEQSLAENERLDAAEKNARRAMEVARADARRARERYAKIYDERHVLPDCKADAGPDLRT